MLQLSVGQKEKKYINKDTKTINYPYKKNAKPPPPSSVHPSYILMNIPENSHISSAWVVQFELNLLQSNKLQTRL